MPVLLHAFQTRVHLRNTIVWSGTLALPRYLQTSTCVTTTKRTRGMPNECSYVHTTQAASAPTIGWPPYTEPRQGRPSPGVYIRENTSKHRAPPVMIRGGLS